MDYHKSKGYMWPNSERVGNQPHYRGHIAVTKEQIKQLVDVARDGGEMKIRLSGWVMQKNGDRYISISAESAGVEKRQEFVDDDIPF